MDSHNFSINTGWEKFDRNGRLIDTEWDRESKTKIEGRVTASLNDKLIADQSMESFCVRLFSLLCCGGRIYGGSSSVLGTSSTPVKIDDTFLKSGVSPSVVTSSTIVFEQFLERENEIEAVLSLDIHIASSQSGMDIAEIGLPIKMIGSQSAIAARDILDPKVRISPNSILKIKWHLHFPETSQKILTRNLLNNIVQACAPDFPNFKKIDGTDATGDHYVSYNTITKLIYGNSGTTGTTNVSDKGIVVGTNGAVKDWNVYSITQPANGTLAYSSMPSLPDDSYQKSTDSKTAWFTVSRDITNVKSADITLREAGLLAKTTNVTDGVRNAGSYLLARWLIDVTLKPSETLRVYFQPKITC